MKRKEITVLKVEPLKKPSSGLGLAYGEDTCRKLTEAELAKEQENTNE